ncbi:hypothetical protein BaRGS_00002702 [Batillaria attramentaria]|uniref:Uncharacterized protein n=1 Tax=Batillaria attramentaria TaxID=370345 RepID=A0ABD0M327_9CAEN
MLNWLEQAFGVVTDGCRKESEKVQAILGFRLSSAFVSKQCAAQKTTPKMPFYTEVPFNGRDWPRESPVARVYDIGNTSTKMVLLNRRLKKKSQLRGLSANNGEIVAPEPDRHVPEEPTTSWHYHKNCLNSSSELYRPKINLNLGWVNSQQRPPVTFDSGSHVNHRRHTSCRVSGESPVVGWNPPRRPHTSASMATEAELRSMGSMLNDPELGPGERRYMYSIARIYSTSQMKQLKKDQYSQLLFRELAKGYHSPYEYERYFSYLNSPRKTQFGKLDTYNNDHRSQSAPPPHHSRQDASGRGTPGGETDRTESRKGHRMTASSRSLTMSSRTSLTSSRAAQRKRGHGKPKSKPAPKKTQQSPPQSAKGSTVSEEKPATPKDEKPVRKGEPEAVAAVAAANSDIVEVETDEKTDEKNDGSIDSYREVDRTRSVETPQREVPSPTEDESPRKGEVTDRSEKEHTEREDEADGDRSEDKDGRSSESVGSNTNTTSSNANNNLLKLIVSDAEKDDDTEKVSAEDVKSSTGEDESAATPEGMVKRFSSTELADGYSPRVNKEGRTRPLSRAGRGDTIRERENSDDDYDDTDEETETAKLETVPEDIQTTKEATQQDERLPLDERTDTARTDGSQAEVRGAMDEEPGTAEDFEKRAGSPEEGDSRAEDNHENNGQRSLIIPVTPRRDSGDENTATTKRKTSNGEVLDLSAEGRNRDVDKIEY